MSPLASLPCSFEFASKVQVMTSMGRQSKELFESGTKHEKAGRRYDFRAGYILYDTAADGIDRGLWAAVHEALHGEGGFGCRKTHPASRKGRWVKIGSARATSGYGDSSSSFCPYLMAERQRRRRPRLIAYQRKRRTEVSELRREVGTQQERSKKADLG